MRGVIRPAALLLAVLLATIPAASADTGFDPDRYPVPDLWVNESIETIAISGELSLQPEPGVTAEEPSGYRSARSSSIRPTERR